MSVARPELTPNEVWRDRYHGRRCFILAAGPSINDMDLLPLAGEIVFTVSNFFVHKDYAAINPMFHCVPKFCSPPFSEADAVRWFREMHERIGAASVFLDLGDRATVQRHGLFKGRDVFYLYTTGAWEDLHRLGLDLSRPVPGIVGVTVMVLMIAMYMGFSEIYLVGCDHDWLREYGVSRHFYRVDERTYGKGSQAAYGEEHWPPYDEGAASIVALWQQYKALQRLAEERGVRVLNATVGGCLDVFERVDFDALMRSRPRVAEAVVS
jgi:hypothetical protein